MIITKPIRLVTFAYALSCFAVLILTSLASAQSSSLEFPYQALVAKDNALVRSGPGEVHYGTQKLAAGQVVEVYRHDPDGWCAIRPVEGSFCIIPEATVEIISEGVGEIKMAGTTPFVGTKLGTVEKPLWQVKLREKEKVSLIGQLSWPNPEGHSTVWYQIKPPAGEFRWINISNLESLSGETMASVIQPKPKKAVVPMPTQPALSTANLPTATSSTAAQHPEAELARSASIAPANITPVKPSFDQATAQQRSDSGNVQPIASAPSQPSAQAVESNNFAADQSQVQLASFAPAAPTPAAAAAPPLQDTGGGWRRATRAIPSDNSSTGSNAGFAQPAMPRDLRSQFDSTPNNNKSSFAKSKPAEVESIRI